MFYQGFKLTLSCVAWEQAAILSQFWHFMSKFVPQKDLVGLGMNWTKDGAQFDYAIGVIDNPSALTKLRAIDFSQTTFRPEYIELSLPALDTWQCFLGKESNLRDLYEKEIDHQNRLYDYELEYFDHGNVQIKIHYID